MKLKAIETIYNGYRFRSRLEARWAVFFDALGIDYEYEPEGIVLSNGSYYLPDFYLLDFHCYFEVKRKSIKGTDEEETAIQKISDGMLTTDWAGIIAFGDPMDDDMYIYCQETDDGGGGSYESEITIGLHPITEKPYLFSYEDSRQRDFYASWDDANNSIIPMVTKEYGKYSYEDFVKCRTKEARRLSRQARFEYGENG